MACNLVITLLISGRATVRYFVACLRLNEKAGIASLRADGRGQTRTLAEGRAGRTLFPIRAAIWQNMLLNTKDGLVLMSIT